MGISILDASVSFLNNLKRHRHLNLEILEHSTTGLTFEAVSQDFAIRISLSKNDINNRYSFIENLLIYRTDKLSGPQFMQFFNKETPEEKVDTHKLGPFNPYTANYWYICSLDELLQFFEQLNCVVPNFGLTPLF